MIKLEDNTTAGECILVYGPMDCGKTGSALTAPDPILHINTEGKDARPVHTDILKFLESQGQKVQKKVTYVRFESYDDQQSNLNEWINQAKDGNFPFKTVFYDGLTFGQQAVKRELEDSRSDIRHDSKEWRGFVDDFRFEKPDWGAMGSAMSRATTMLMRLSGFGITVICTALEDNNYPKWGKGLRIGPALVGQDFSKLLTGYFHFIGYVVQPFHLDPDGKVTQPVISFGSVSDPNGNDFLARSSSIALTKMGPAPLQWERIIKVIRGQ
jgi:hypothetical protein